MKAILTRSVIVGALGYFVDIYDLLLFGIVRVPSLKDLGIAPENLLDVGAFLINMQMIGLLVGGVVWGVLSDKKGRVAALFGSILLYSLANIANAFVTTIEIYGALRFIAGIGLAGELGAAITLVSETLPKETRGYGTTLVAAFGILGAVVAALIGDLFSWRVAYGVGGVLGLVLLAARVSMLESGMYESLKHNEVSRGKFFSLFTSKERVTKYLACIAIGIPIWYVIGILVTFSPEFGSALGATETIAAGRSIMFCYIGLSLGDLASGFISQWIRSRKKAVAIFLAVTLFGVVLFLSLRNLSPTVFYALCLLLGFGSGYWAVFMTTSAEQFGINLRATATTSVPNFVRASVVPMTFIFRSFIATQGIIVSGAIVGGLAFAIAIVGLVLLRESFGKDLNFTEPL
jgi:MFS transporter, putative metabolite:H+ symporter